jgi:FixJ family two-component response regulator
METKENGVEKPLVSIVDDDLSVGRSTRRLLRSAGFWAEAFASAEEFLMSGLAEKTACVVLDLRMPGMNGLQLQQHLAVTSNSPSVVFLTAKMSEGEKRQALNTGVAQFLHKPVNKEVLLTAIHNAMKT